MEGFPSNLNDTFTSTRGCAEPMFFPQHILPLLPLYNAQWWGYESLTAIVLVSTNFEANQTWLFRHHPFAVEIQYTYILQQDISYVNKSEPINDMVI